MATNQQTGLIQNAQSTSYDPEKMTLDPATMTVQGRVQDIMKSDSPFVAQAQTAAAQAQNAKGTLNSSMAIGEGQKAAYNAALPIAQNDASAALNVASQNTAATNTARQAGSTAENQMGLQTLQGQQQLGITQEQGKNQIALAQEEAKYKSLMQTNDTAGRIFSQTQLSISEINKEPNITPENKAKLVQNQLDLLKASMATIGGISGLDLSQYLDFGSTSLSPTPAAPAAPAAPAMTEADVTRIIEQEAQKRAREQEYQG